MTDTSGESLEVSAEDSGVGDEVKSNNPHFSNYCGLYEILPGSWINIDQQGKSNGDRS